MMNRCINNPNFYNITPAVLMLIKKVRILKIRLSLLSSRQNHQSDSINSDLACMCANRDIDITMCQKRDIYNHSFTKNNNLTIYNGDVFDDINNKE